MLMRVLVWFRTDLRVVDNPALHHACGSADRGVVALFVITAKQWRGHDWGANKVDFILRNLDSLSKSLKKLNIPLLVRSAGTFTQVPSTLRRVAKDCQCDTLCFNAEYEVNERRRDEAVRRAFEQRGLKVHMLHDQTVIRPDVIRTKEDRFYTVFTPFKRAWLGHLAELGRPAPLGRPKRQAELVAAPDIVPERWAGFASGEAIRKLWPAGEKTAHRRLAAFIEHHIADYKRKRDEAAIKGTSRLSPYLAAGVISARQCLDAALQANNGRLETGRAGPLTWISELIWREFYRHILVGFPRVSMNRAFRLETERLAWRDDAEGFEAWCEGRTGFPIIDAAMRQLNETGWMHNRLRMIVAMFLTKDLFIDWRRGERYFMQHLIDGDLASNNGGWQWAASTGTDAAPYFRIFNPFSQSRKFDAAGDFIRRYVPELRDAEGDAVHEPARLPEMLRSMLDYPEPIVDHAEARQRTIAAFRALKE